MYDAVVRVNQPESGDVYAAIPETVDVQFVNRLKTIFKTATAADYVGKTPF